jgi:hypothetical protein
MKPNNNVSPSQPEIMVVFSEKYIPADQRRGFIPGAEGEK